MKPNKEHIPELLELFSHLDSAAGILKRLNDEETKDYRVYCEYKREKSKPNEYLEWLRATYSKIKPLVGDCESVIYKKPTDKKQ